MLYQIQKDQYARYYWSHFIHQYWEHIRKKHSKNIDDTENHDRQHKEDAGHTVDHHDKTVLTRDIGYAGCDDKTQSEIRAYAPQNHIIRSCHSPYAVHKKSRHRQHHCKRQHQAVPHCGRRIRIGTADRVFKKPSHPGKKHGKRTSENKSDNYQEQYRPNEILSALNPGFHNWRHHIMLQLRAWPQSFHTSVSYRVLPHSP